MATKMVSREDIAAEIGRRVLKLRQAKRTSSGKPASQEMIARESGLSKGAIQLVEAGRMLPGIDVLFKLADGLGVDYTELVPERLLSDYSKIRDMLDKLRRKKRVA